MALANVADILVRRGLRVLMIDFDLEAPGLEQYFQVDQRKIRANLGLLDLILRYKAAMSVAADDERVEEFRQLQERFITQIYPRREGGGQLDLMTAGQRGDDEQLAQYALNLRQFDWQDFFFNWGGELFFEWMRHALDRQLYDVVLVDSRTGVTEMGGICAYQLADVIVVLCAANQQNLEGTHDIVRNFSSARVKMLRNNRDLPMIVVPARIELQDALLVADFRKRFEALFGEYVPTALEKTGIRFWDLLIPYEPQYAFQERVVATGDPRRHDSVMHSALQKLVDAIGTLGEADDPVRKLVFENGRAETPAEPEYDLTSRSAGFDVFLSYSQVDVTEVREISHALRQRNLLVFFDETDLRSGDPFLQTVTRALEQSRACAILVGASQDYPWRQEFIRAEIEASISRGLRLVPVLLPGASLPPTSVVPAYLAGVQWCEIQSLDDVNAIDRLVMALTSAQEARRATTTVAEVVPYRGLQAFDEPDAPFFFGREKLIEEMIAYLRDNAFLAVVGASSIGKTSAVRAGLVPALRRGGIRGAEEWDYDYISFTPGNESDTDFLQIIRKNSRGGRRLLIFDQFEEIFNPARSAALSDFIKAFAQIAANRATDKMSIVIVIRSDFFGRVLQVQSLANLVRPNSLFVSPLTSEELRSAIEAPAHKAGVAVESGLTDLIMKDVADAPGALPFMQYVLLRLWEERRSGYLTVEAYRRLGGVYHALAREADEFLSKHPNSGSALQRIFSLKLALIREDGALARRRARRSEFTDEEWQLVSELVARRLLVTGSTGTDESYVEVAHEAIFRGWDRLREWIDIEREFLIWRNRLETSRRTWQQVGSRDEALLMGAALAKAQHYLGERAQDLGLELSQFIETSIAAERKRRRRFLRLQLVALTLFLGVAGLVVAFGNKAYLQQKFQFFVVTLPYVRSQVSPYVLSLTAERALRPGDSFKECAKYCPEMIVIPAGSFTMGSEQTEWEMSANESPKHVVSIAKPFAVSKFEVTFEDWDACTSYGDCERISDSGFGRGTRSVINVSWEAAKRYAAWLSKTTGQPYRLLSEAEYEYAARAGTETVFPWGNDVGKGNANCNGCGSRFDNTSTAPVGSFAPNGFGLFDMVGNVWEWVEDCWHTNYIKAPVDGSAWSANQCTARVIRGGSWSTRPLTVRSAHREPFSSVEQNNNLGFRVARTFAF